jgi:hypothetical protein
VLGPLKTGAASRSNTISGRSATAGLRISVIPGLRSRRGRALAGVLALTALVFAETFHAPGAYLDEGLLVTYPAQILDGRLPYRDFFSFYGPADFFLLAGVFKVFGTSLYVERAVGVGYVLLVVAGAFELVFGVTRRVASAVTVAVTMLIILLATQPSALALVAALAAALWALRFLVDVLVGQDAFDHRGRSFASGVLVGVAAVFRPDFGAAALIGCLPCVFALRHRDAVAWIAGVALSGISLISIPLMAGSTRLNFLWHYYLRSAKPRQLPFPPPLFPAGLPFALCSVAVIASIIAWLWLRQRNLLERRRTALLSMALLALAFLPYFRSRAEFLHLIPMAAAAVAAGFTLAALVPDEIYGVGRFRHRLDAIWSGVAVLALTVAALLAVVQFAIGRQINRGPAIKAANMGREFLIERYGARALVESISAIARISHRGQTLFVGPYDLRYADFNYTFVYFLFPDLRPSTPFLELNPGGANSKAAHLDRLLKRTDVLLLSGGLQRSPRSSDPAGPDTPNQVIARDFCVVAVYGSNRVFRRCRNTV